jgi:hypothetical protein
MGDDGIRSIMGMSFAVPVCWPLLFQNTGILPTKMIHGVGGPECVARNRNVYMSCVTHFEISLA